MSQAIAAIFMIGWLIAIGWQANNIYRAWIAYRNTRRRPHCRGFQTKRFPA